MKTIIGYKAVAVGIENENGEMLLIAKSKKIYPTVTIAIEAAEKLALRKKADSFLIETIYQ
jgi:hypothetical protein